MSVSSVIKKRVSKHPWFSLGAVLLIFAGGWFCYRWLAAPRLIVGRGDIIISQGCDGHGSTYVVIYSDGGGYVLEGHELSCLGGPPSSPGSRHNLPAGFIDYKNLQRAVNRARSVRTAGCIADESFIQVQYAEYSNGDLNCYGSNSTNVSGDTQVQRLNALSDAVTATTTKAYQAAGVEP